MLQSAIFKEVPQVLRFTLYDYIDLLKLGARIVNLSTTAHLLYSLLIQLLCLSRLPLCYLSFCLQAEMYFRWCPYCSRANRTDEWIGGKWERGELPAGPLSRLPSYWRYYKPTCHVVSSVRSLWKQDQIRTAENIWAHDWVSRIKCIVVVMTAHALIRNYRGKTH